MAKRTVSCPTCGKTTEFSPANRWRPFCSERCRMMDLGAWAAEKYRIEAVPDKGEPGADDADPESR